MSELGYAFLFRKYRPEPGKWQTADPLGYPDGWNNFAYVNNGVTMAIDWIGGYILSNGAESTHEPGVYVASGNAYSVGGFLYSSGFGYLWNGLCMGFEVTDSDAGWSDDYFYTVHSDGSVTVDPLFSGMVYSGELHNNHYSFDFYVSIYIYYTLRKEIETVGDKTKYTYIGVVTYDVVSPDIEICGTPPVMEKVLNVVTE